MSSVEAAPAKGSAKGFPAEEVGGTSILSDPSLQQEALEDLAASEPPFSQDTEDPLVDGNAISPCVWM